MNAPPRLEFLAAIALTLLLASVFGMGPSAVAAPPGAKVMPVQGKAFGQSYAELSVAWWRWAYGTPAPPANPESHPLLASGQVDCGTGQTGRVWFLAGIYNETGSAQRTCTIPSGTPLFFPIINYECNNVFPPDGLSDEERVALCVGIVDSAMELEVVIDTVPVKNVAQYRATVTEPFTVDIPEHSLHRHFEVEYPAGSGNPVPAGTYETFVADGYYLLLPPLSVGEHNITFSGSVPRSPPVPNGFGLAIEYDITVVPRGAKARP